MRKFFRALLIWLRGNNLEREWYRRQEQAIRDSKKHEPAGDPD